MSGSIVSRGLMLLAWVVTARIVVPGDYGRLNLVWILITFLTGLVGLGLTVAVTRQVAEASATAPETAGRYIGVTLSLTLVSAIVVGTVMVLLRRPAADALLGSSARGSLIVASAAAVLFSALNSAIQAALLGLQDSRSIAGAQSMQGSGGALGLIVGAASGGTTGAIVGLAIGQAVAACLSFFLLRTSVRSRRIHVSYRTYRQDLARLGHIAGPTLVGSAVLAAAVLGAQVVLSRQTNGFDQVAVFNLSYRWYQAILFVPAAIVPLLLPVMTRHYSGRTRHEVRSVFAGSFRGMVIMTIVPAVVVVIAAPLLLGFSGGFYSDHPVPLFILAAAAIPTTINNVISNAAVGLGLIREWLISDVVLSGVLLGSAIVLVAALHATGLALAYLVGFIATDLVLAAPLIARLRALPERA